MALFKETQVFFIGLILFSLFSCKPVKTALELNNKKYSKIKELENSTINTKGVYVLQKSNATKETSSKSKAVTALIKFNTNKTVQFSSKKESADSNEQPTNTTITEWLNNYTSSYYYTRNDSKLIIEHYISNPIKTSWYALNGPASAPFKFKIQYKISGDTLIKNNERYLLDKTLTNNHKNITTDFISLN